MSPHCAPEQPFPPGENGSCGFNMQLMAHLITYSSLHFRLAVFSPLSPALVGFHPHLTLLICPNPSSRTPAFSYLFAQLICNTALTYRLDNEVETSCNGWMKSMAIVFQLLCSRGRGGRKVSRAKYFQTIRPHKHRNYRRISTNN